MIRDAGEGVGGTQRGSGIGEATLGSSGPRMLGLRCTVNFWRGARRALAGSLGVLLLEGFEICFVVLLSCFDFTGDGVSGDSIGGVGDEALTLAFLAFLLRSFSSSSDVVTSDRLE